MSAIIGLQRSEVEGVPVYWTDAAPDAQFAAGLVFRVGFSDETLRTRGMTHLVEHLALPAASRSAVDFGGEVDDTTTLFWFAGERAAALEVMAETCRMLTELPLRRLERERQTLRAEAAQRSRGFFTNVRGLRFGAGGHGLADYDEYALDWAGPEEVASWAAERFNRNAVAVYMTGPPDDVVVDLPEGRRFDPAPVAPIPYLTLPSVYGYGHDGGVGIAYVCERTHAASAAGWILERRIRDRLRFRAGISYEVTSWFEPLTRDAGHWAMWTDCLDTNVDAVRSGILIALDELATKGPTSDELSENYVDHRRRTVDPLGLSSRLFWRAAAELMDHPTASDEEELAARAALRADEVAGAARNAYETLLLSIPTYATPPGGRFAPYPVDSPQQVSGRRFRRRGLPFRKRENERELVVGDEGITLIGEDYARTVFFDACVGVIHSGGGRGLWGRDGFFVWVDPDLWRSGDDIVRAVDTHVSGDRVIDLDSERGPFDDPDLAAGVVAMEDGAPDEAAALFRLGLERWPEDPMAWAYLAYAELQRGRPADAVTPAERASTLDSHLSWPHSVRAHALWGSDRKDEAATAMQDALALDPAGLAVLTDVAWFAAETANEAVAARTAARAIELFPDEGSAWFAQGWVDQAFGRLAEGEQAMRRAVELEPDEALWHNNLGWILLKARRPGDAMRHLERALELDDSNRYAAGNRTVALRALGRQEEADRLRTATLTANLEEAEATLRDTPNDVEALTERARALWRLRRYDEALAAARLASTERSDKRVWTMLAQLETAFGEPARALQAAEQATRLCPADMSALVQLVETAAFTGQTDDASEHAREAVARNDGDPAAWYADAVAAYARSELEHADAQASRIRALTWLDCCTNALYGLVSHARGETAEARKALDEARVVEPACLVAVRLEAALAR